MLEYVLGALLILILVYYCFFLESAEHGISWILNQPKAPGPPVTLPIAIADIPKPPPLPLDTTVMAYATYADAHTNRLKDSVKRADGMTMLDTELESRFLNPSV